jgi:hypothetical protein
MSITSMASPQPPCVPSLAWGVPYIWVSSGLSPLPPLSLSLCCVPLTDFPGAEDMRRQSLNVFRMKLLGAKVVAVDAGSRTLRDAVNECLRNWVKSLSTTHYIIG